MRRMVALVGCGIVLAACGPDGQPEDVAAPTSLSPSAASPSPPPPPPAPTTSPFSGREGGVGTPVIVVKLDNTPSAQPHRGVVKADIVYVEPVEWGLTRLAAVFSTDMPGTVGPVRSARVSDIELFAPLGDIAFVYSGAQRRLQSKLAAADWTQVSQDVNSPGFQRERGTGRYAPYNLMADPQTILATSGASAVSQDIGLVFDQEPPDGGSRATRVTARWPSMSVQFRWNAKKKAYDVWMNGRQARDTDKPGVQRASTVIVQYVKEVDSGYGDKFGGRTPLTILTGSGKGLLLRDGKSQKILWEKALDSDPTSYTDLDGNPAVLDPGQVWILLKDRTSKVTVE
ncbi:MAG TPA: DUF3048 domain-containing protein [Motilibacterales bacterium]|nr:DUF3048 domain-containing protein [Motilibacterales bacterium]